MTSAIPCPLSPEQRESVCELFQSASEQPVECRIAFVEHACPSDEAVRREVLRLLAVGEQTEELCLKPAMAEVAELLGDEPLKPGRQLGRYRILKLLGEGGMGRVYLARDDIGKEVAIKLAMADDADWLERLEREARAQARLNHPNIAAIHSREARDGMRFLVLEYVRGQTLAARLREGGQLAAEDAIRIFAGIADALEFLHKSGRIHRDLKPSNVMITPEGTPKLLDFGISKRMVQEAETSSQGSQASANDQSTTRSDSMNEWRTQWGGTPGTLLYMSPEQLRGNLHGDAVVRQELDERVDWWAFGLMFYEALTGRRPFEREKNEDTRAAILAAVPDWTLLPQRTPKPLRELLRRCLEKDRQRRLRDAAEVKRLLNAASPDPFWRLLKKKLHQPAFRLALAGLAMLITLAVFIPEKDTGANPSPSKRPSITVIFKEEAAQATNKANVCGEDRNSRVFAQLLAQRLKAVPDLVVRSSDRALENLSAAIGLAELSTALDVDWTVCITARCAGQQLAIGYEIADRQGRVLARGERQEIAALHDAVLGEIGVKPPVGQPQGDGQKYLAALDLMARYGNGRALDDAIAILEELRANNSASARTNSALAKAHYLILNLARSRGTEGNTSEIRRKIREYCELSARNSDDDETAEAKINCGYIFSMLGQHETAVADLESVRSRRAYDPEFHLTLAEAYEGLAMERQAGGIAADAEFAEAEQRFLNALALRRDWGTLMDVGAFYFARTRYEKAVEYWEQAAKLLSGDPRSAGNLCAGYLYLERFGDALPRCRQAVWAGEPESRQTYGTALWLSGNCDEARIEFEKGRDEAAQSSDLLPELLGGYADACRCAAAPGCDPERDYLRAVALLRQQSAAFVEDAARASAFSLTAEWLAKAGRKAEARQELKRISNPASCQADCAVSSIKAHHLTGDREQTLKLVQESINHAERRKILFNLKLDPDFNGLRGDPQVQRLIATQSSDAR